jgi:hypothetical protein
MRRNNKINANYIISGMAWEIPVGEYGWRTGMTCIAGRWRIGGGNHTRERRELGFLKLFILCFWRKGVYITLKKKKITVLRPGGFSKPVRLSGLLALPVRISFWFFGFFMCRGFFYCSDQYQIRFNRFDC